MYQPNQQYVSDLFTKIEDEISDNYHKSGSNPKNPVEDYHKNDEYMKNEDSPDEDYHKMEEEEEKEEEETEELEEDDEKYKANEETEDETKTKSNDDRPQQNQTPKKKVPKKKSTIEDAILKAQKEIKSMD